MFKFLFVLLIGMFIGWNFPQPDYAKRLQDLVVDKWKEVTGQTDDSNDNN